MLSFFIGSGLLCFGIKTNVQLIGHFTNYKNWLYKNPVFVGTPICPTGGKLSGL